MRRHCADIARDRHAVVVEDHDQRLTRGAGVVQSLIGKPAAEGTVTDEGDDAVILAQERARLGHAQRHRDRVGGMSGDKGVVHAFARLGKAGDAAKLTQRGKLLPPPGEDLVTIALVSHVEHQPVS